MPKKTRKNKIRASARRASQDHVTTPVVNESHILHPNTFSMESKNENVKISRPVSPKQNDIHVYDYVFQDLKKIFIFALLAIAIQGVLVFLLRTK